MSFRVSITGPTGCGGQAEGMTLDQAYATACIQYGLAFASTQVRCQQPMCRGKIENGRCMACKTPITVPAPKVPCMHPLVDHQTGYCMGCGEAPGPVKVPYCTHNRWGRTDGHVTCAFCGWRCPHLATDDRGCCKVCGIGIPGGVKNIDRSNSDDEEDENGDSVNGDPVALAIIKDQKPDHNLVAMTLLALKDQKVQDAIMQIIKDPRTTLLR